MTPSAASERQNQIMVEHIPDLVFGLDEQGKIITINQAVNAYGFSSSELIGCSLMDVIYSKDRDRVRRDFDLILAQGKNLIQIQQFRICTKSGAISWVEVNSAFQFACTGRFIRQVGVCRDITERIVAQQALLKTQDELEELVHKRTEELILTNKDLQREIEERMQTEGALREREKELETEKANLEEANTALKVLLKRREEDKRQIEEKVIYNVKKMLLPYVEKLKQKPSRERRMAFLSIIETNLNDITHDFSRRLSIEFYGLTRSELKVANFIRQGKKNREIAHLLGISIRTVETYRLAVRHKLRIQNKKVNLRTFLMSYN